MRERVARALDEMGHLLIIAGQDAHKAPSYYRAARSVRKYPGDLAHLIDAGELTRLEGVGPAIAAKITGIARHGSFPALELLRESFPEDILSLTRVTGIGARTAGRLYRDLGVENLSDLEMAIRRHDVRRLAGMGPRREEQLSVAVRNHYALRDLTPLYRALWLASKVLGALESHPDVVEAAVAGRARRRVAEFTRLDVVAVTANGRAPSVDLPGGMDMEVHWCAPDARGTAMLRHTGSEQHWRQLALRAESQGMVLDETGLWRGERRIAGDSEGAVYEALGLEAVPPELREGSGEIELAEAGVLPQRLETGDIKGDLHTHTTWSDGVSDLREMVDEAVAMGYEYIAITDHSQSLAVARGLDPERLVSQGAEIEKAGAGLGIDILRGSEIDIKSGGEMDFPDSVMEELDVVVASIHTAFQLSEEEQTRRLVRACQNPHVDIIGHPTGRVLGYRSGYAVNQEQLVQAGRDTGTALEINASPDRMDVGDDLARKAARAGVPLVISSDAHSRVAIRDLSFGIYVARRAGVGPDGVMNTRSQDELRRWLDAPKPRR